MRRTVGVSPTPSSPHTVRYWHRDSPLQDGKVSEKVGSPEAGVWNEAQHVYLINAKLYAARDVLAAGFGVFLTDIDVVLLQDPRPYFRGVLDANPDVTMVFQDDTQPQMKLSLNSGFFYYKACTQNIILASAFITRLEWWQIDQTRINVVLNRTTGYIPETDSFWKKGTIPYLRMPIVDAPNGESLQQSTDRV